MKTLKVNSLIKITLIYFVFIIVNCTENRIEINYDLKISYETKKPFYILKNSTISTIGTNFDSLKDNLDQIRNSFEECVYYGKGIDSCLLILPQKCLIVCPGKMQIEKLFNLNRILDYNNGVTCFDLKVGKNIIHSVGIMSMYASLTRTAEGKQIDYTWEKEWNNLRLLCDLDQVIILKNNDTLFNGNYNQLNQKCYQQLFNRNNITLTYHKLKLPIVTINPTCNLTMNKISELSKHFPEKDQILFQFGKYFGCTDSLRDIWADTFYLNNR
jgi:hypothetical protein